VDCCLPDNAENNGSGSSNDDSQVRADVVEAKTQGGHASSQTLEDEVLTDHGEYLTIEAGFIFTSHFSILE
jgi:hypothetical protein